MTNRITNRMITDTFMHNLNSQMGRMNRLDSQLSSQRRITRISDDPVGVLSSMSARQRLMGLEQYSQNLDSARTYVDQSETSIQQVVETLTNVRDNIVNGSSGTNNTTDRENFGVYMKQMRDNLVDLGNTSIGGKYIFGGFNTTKPPFKFAADGTVSYNGLNLSDTTAPNDAAIAAEKSQHTQMEVGAGVLMDVTMTGVELAGTGKDNMFDVMSRMISDLESGANAKDLTKYIGEIDTLIDNTTSNQVSVGGKQVRLELMANRYMADEISFTKAVSDVEDIDTAETIMNFMMAEAVYQQALSVGSRVIMPTLMDFLR